MAALRAKHPKKQEPRKPKIVVFGKPGVGKTWTSLDYPKVFYVDTEGGATLNHYTDKLVNSGGVYLGPEDGANDFGIVLEQIKLLATSKHEHQTLVIDSYSKLFNTRVSEKYEAMEQGGSDMDKTFGREKKPAIASTRQMITWFDRLDMNVLLVCHEKDVWQDGKVIGQTFDGWDKLEYELDLVLRVVKQGPSRKAVVGKNRLEQFKEGESIEWSYESFAERYGRSVIEAGVNHVEVATSEQVATVKHLADAFKLDDEMRIKWFEKAGVDAWEEMDATTIAKCISYLKAKLPEPAIA